MKISNFLFINIATLILSINLFADQATDEMEKPPQISVGKPSGCASGSCPAPQSGNMKPAGCASGSCPAPDANKEKSSGCASGSCPAPGTDKEKPSGCASGSCPAPNADKEKSCGDAGKSCKNDPVDAEEQLSENTTEQCCKVESEEVYCRCCFPFSLSHTEGNWFDNRVGYTSVNMLWPFKVDTCCNWYPFLDLRGHVFNDGKTAGNFGGGLRIINDSNRCTVFGLNAFYDFRKAAWNHYFHQIGLGFEILNPCFDFRLNGYFPLGNRTGRSRNSCFNFGDGFRASCHQQRSAQTGFDAEVGKWIVRNNCGNFDLYFALGAYSYFPKNHGRRVVGGQVRLNSNLIRYFNLELRGGYDQVNSSQAQVKLTANFPIGVYPCNNYDNCFCINDRLCQPIHREEIIHLGEKECCWDWNWE